MRDAAPTAAFTKLPAVMLLEKMLQKSSYPALSSIFDIISVPHLVAFTAVMGSGPRD